MKRKYLRLWAILIWATARPLTPLGAASEAAGEGARGTGAAEQAGRGIWNRPARVPASGKPDGGHCRVDVCRSERCWATSFISAGSLAKVKHTHQRRASFTRRLSFLFRARRVEFFAGAAGPRLPSFRPGGSRATTCALLLVQEPQYRVAVARA